MLLPDGVIGNTWAFGAYIPGSSPGRVVLYNFDSEFCWLRLRQVVVRLVLEFLLLPGFALQRAVMIETRAEVSEESFIAGQKG